MTRRWWLEVIAGVVVAVVGGGFPGKVMKTRAKIAAKTPISDLLG